MKTKGEAYCPICGRTLGSAYVRMIHLVERHGYRMPPGHEGRARPLVRAPMGKTLRQVDLQRRRR